MSDLSTGGGGDSSRRDHERVDALFEALADTQRRQVIRYFQHAEDDVTSFDSLIDFAIEAETTEVTRARLELTFHHVTLPKLADLGVIEYDARSRAVRYSGSPDLERILTFFVEAELPAG